MLTMIIADDEEIIREGLRDCIGWQDLGIQIVGEAGNGKEALRKVKELRPDILMTDIVMPGMNGISLIEAIREADARVKIVMISAYQDVQYMKSAFKFDASDYILKPFSNEELIGVVERITAQIRHQREQEQLVEQARRVLHGTALDASPPPEDNGSPPSRERKLVRTVMELLETRMDEEWTLQQVADEVYLSPSHMAYVFKKETGETVLDYLSRLRMERAKSMLDHDAYKIYQVAEAIGYRDANYFSKLFKKYYGVTPKEYRCRS